MKLPRVALATWLSAVVVIATVFLVIFMVVRQAQAVDNLRAQYNELYTQYSGLYEEAVVAGAEPDAPAPEDVPEADETDPQIQIPEPQPTATGAAGERGPGPTREQVREVVEDLLATGNYDGEDGQPPTDAEIDAAVERYCAEDACDGEPGINGVNGTNGTNGSDGTNGVGVSSVVCQEDGAWLITYTDETTSATGDTCKGATGDRGPGGPAGADGTQFPLITKTCSAGEVMTGFKIDGPAGTAEPYCEPLTSTWFTPVPWEPAGNSILR